MIKIKSGVSVSKQVVIACAVVNAAIGLDLPHDMVITSGRDGVHREGSLHYRDRALDFRTKHLTIEEKRALVRATQKRLGADYDVILESLGAPNEHLHIEIDGT